MKTFHVTIARVDTVLFDAKAAAATVPGCDGELTIMAGHKPLITPLVNGTITVTNENHDTESFPIDSGTLELHDNRVCILVR